MPHDVHYFLCDCCNRSWDTWEEARQCEIACSDPATRKGWTYTETHPWDKEDEAATSDDAIEIVRSIIGVSGAKTKPKRKKKTTLNGPTYAGL